LFANTEQHWDNSSYFKWVFDPQETLFDFCNTFHPFSSPPSNADLHEMPCFGSSLGPACSRVGKWVRLRLAVCKERLGAVLRWRARHAAVWAGGLASPRKYTSLVPAPKQSVKWSFSGAGLPQPRWCRPALMHSPSIGAVSRRQGSVGLDRRAHRGRLLLPSASVA